MATVRIRSSISPLWEHWSGTLANGVYGVFRYALNEQDHATLYNLLTPEEQQQSKRYRQPSDRQRFAAGRAWLRWVIGRLAGLKSAEVLIRPGQYGKPELPNAVDAGGAWFANVSHAGSWVLLAVARTKVGIDVEPVTTQFDYASLLESSFSPVEQARITNSLDPRRCFYEFWTRKESLLKATGQGLTDDLCLLPASEGVHQIPTGLLAASGTLSVCSFTVTTACVGAVACLADTPSIQFFTLSLPLFPDPTLPRYDHRY